MSTLNYIDENGNINKAGCIPQNYPASNIGYNNSQSRLSATNVQGAIDDLADSVTEQINNLQDNKVDTSAIANNVTTTDSGKVLDARQGTYLKGLIDNKANANSIPYFLNNRATATNVTSISFGALTDNSFPSVFIITTSQWASNSVGGCIGFYRYNSADGTKNGVVLVGNTGGFSASINSNGIITVGFDRQWSYAQVVVLS